VLIDYGEERIVNFFLDSSASSLISELDLGS
jgi:hypothetical protein